MSKMLLSDENITSTIAKLKKMAIKLDNDYSLGIIDREELDRLNIFLDRIPEEISKFDKIPKPLSIFFEVRGLISVMLNKNTGIFFLKRSLEVSGKNEFFTKSARLMLDKSVKDAKDKYDFDHNPFHIIIWIFMVFCVAFMIYKFMTTGPLLDMNSGSGDYCDQHICR